MLNDTWEIEEIILGMADIVMECRRLRRENAELLEFKEKYYKEVDARFKDAQMHSANILHAVLTMAEREETK